MLKCRSEQDAKRVAVEVRGGLFNFKVCFFDSAETMGAMIEGELLQISSSCFKDKALNAQLFIDATTLVPPPEEFLASLLFLPVPLMAGLVLHAATKGSGPATESDVGLEEAVTDSGDIVAGVVDEDVEEVALSLLLISCSITFSCSGERKLFFVLRILLLLLS